jgi:hypothetical protein
MSKRARFYDVLQVREDLDHEWISVEAEVA